MINWYEPVSSLGPGYIREQLRRFFDEDMPLGDPSCAGLPVLSEKSVKARFIARQKMVFAGREILETALSGKYSYKPAAEDGQSLEPGSLIGEAEGPAAGLLQMERTLLNLIQRLSGIATLTRRYVQAAGGAVKILDTRKTTPGLRLFEKYAVHCGGGFNHRRDLSQGIMLKDNHLASVGNITDAIHTVRSAYPSLILEVEVDSPGQLEAVLEGRPDAVLLDNMDPHTVFEAVTLIRGHKNGKNIFIEASGGITLETLRDYLDTGLNGISIGALTHSAPAADIGLDID